MNVTHRNPTTSYQDPHGRNRLAKVRQFTKARTWLALHDRPAETPGPPDYLANVR
jgi:hypothetical protein